MEEEAKNGPTKRKQRNSPDQHNGKNSSTAKKVKSKNFTLSTSDEDSDSDERFRTPSGTVVPKIANIRSYFSPCQTKGSKESRSCPSVNELNQPRHCANESLNRRLNHGKSVSCEKINKKAIETKSSKAAKKIDPKCKNITPIKKTISSQELVSPSKQTLNAIASVIEAENYEDFKRRIESENQRQVRNKKSNMTDRESESNMDSEMEMREDSVSDDRETQPKTITLSLIYEMFKDLKKDVAQLKSNSDEQEKRLVNECTEKATQNVKEEVDNIIDEEHKKQIKSVKDELKFCQLKNEILSDICTGMSTEIADLNQKVEHLELNAAKKSIIITGLTLRHNRKDDAIQEIEEFMDTNLHTPVVVDDYFYLGQAIVIEFQCAADRRSVLKNKSMLKDIPGNIFINEYTPLFTNEKRRRERQIVRDLDDIAKKEKTEINVEYTAAGLTVQGTPYRKQVVPPTAKELISLSVKELDKIINLKMQKGKVIVKDNSRFLAYTAEASSYQQIREMYMKIKLTRPEARHAVCAYIIPGLHHNARDFHDDGEPGAGRVLLQQLEDRGLNNIAVFVIRKY